jgi:hypothetical protein
MIKQFITFGSLGLGLVLVSQLAFVAGTASARQASPLVDVAPMAPVVVPSIDLPPVVITGSAVPYDAAKCPALLAKYGDDADYRCPRPARGSHDRTVPSGRLVARPIMSKCNGTERTFGHVLDQGGTHTFNADGSVRPNLVLASGCF